MLARHCMQVHICGGVEMSESEISKAAKTLSKLGASKGGKARAEYLSPEERTEIASKAASVRWGIPRADHVGEIHIGDMRFPCSVLSDGPESSPRAILWKAWACTIAAGLQE